MYEYCTYEYSYIGITRVKAFLDFSVVERELEDLINSFCDSPYRTGTCIPASSSKVRAQT